MVFISVTMIPLKIVFAFFYLLLLFTNYIVAILVHVGHQIHNTHEHIILSLLLNVIMLYGYCMFVL